MAHKVFIQGPGQYAYIAMFLMAGFTGARTIDEADIVCFTGGEDVHPHYYNEDPIPATYFNIKRDEDDVKAFKRCIEQEKFMVGICRGAQFLNVMAGGKLWQDVDNHTTSHFMTDLITGEKVFVTSTHHQQMIPAPHGDILAAANRCNQKTGFGKSWKRGHDKEDAFDVEAVWYGKERALCFQPHPEFMGAPPDCRKYFFDLMDRFWKTTEKEAEAA